MKKNIVESKSNLRGFIDKTFPVLRASKSYLLSKVYKRKNIGRGAYVDSSVHVLGWRTVSIGINTVVSEGGWINVNHRQSNVIQVSIEDNCFIGRRNFLSSGSLIRLGSYCLTGPDCKFLGSNHIFLDPYKPYIATGTTDDSVIDVGVNCWFGAGVVVVGAVKIGYGCIVGANALISFDVPPFSMVVGNPGRIVKRYDVTSKKWISWNSSIKIELAGMPSEIEYLEILRMNYSKIPMPLVASGKAMGDLP